MRHEDKGRQSKNNGLDRNTGDSLPGIDAHHCAGKVWFNAQQPDRNLHRLRPGDRFTKRWEGGPFSAPEIARAALCLVRKRRTVCSSPILRLGDYGHRCRCHRCTAHLDAQCQIPQTRRRAAARPAFLRLLISIHLAEQGISVMRLAFTRRVLHCRLVGCLPLKRAKL